ncbi:MAG: PAS domain S-box protein [Syntrophales bacterium]
MRRKIILLFCLLALCLLTMPAAGQSVALGIPRASLDKNAVAVPGVSTQTAVHTPAKNSQILILDGVQEGLPQPATQLRAIMDTLKKNSFSLNNVFIEHLDLARYPTPEHRANLKQLLRHKFAHQHIGMIICINQNSFEFLIADLRDLLPDVPALLVNVQKPDVFKDGTKRKIIELFFQEDIAGTLRYATTLFPEKRRLVVINGHDDRDVPFIEATAKAIDSLPKKLDVEYTRLLSYEEMLKKISALPPDTIAFLGPYFNDRTGRRFVPAEVAAVVAKTANVPVFAEVDALIRQGLFGGSTVLTDMTGKRTAEIAIDYLNGKISPTRQKTRFEMSNVPLFNWQQIDRWKITVSSLPANSIFINRPLTLWGQYRTAVLSAMLVIIILIAFMVALIIQNRRRKTSENMARESEELFRSLFEDHAAVKLIIDPATGNIVNANHAAAAFYGWPRETLTAMKIQEITLLPPEAVTQEMERAVAATADHFEFQHRLADGSIRAVSMFSSGVKIKGRMYLHSIIHDITERTQMEAALKAESTRRRIMFEQSPDGILIIDQQTGGFLDFNTAAHRQLGYSREEFAQLSIMDIEARETAGEIKAHIAKVLQNGKDNFETLQRTKQGELRNVYVTAQIINIQGHQVYQCVWRDITDGKRAEEDRLRLAAAIQQSGEMVVMTDKEGIIQYVNPAFEQITGYACEEAVGKNPRLLKSGKQGFDFYKELWETLTAGVTWKGHFVNKKKDGGFFEEEATISPVKNLSGEITHYVAVKSDVTEQLKTEKQLFQAQKMEAIGTMAGGIAHDFNNILGAISGYTEISLAKIPSDSRIKYYLEQIHTSCQRAINLVRQILEFSRLTEKERTPISLIPLIKETIKMLREIIPSTIEIRLNAQTDADADADTVLGDATQIYQILMNLCTNAYQAMKDKGGLLEIDLVRIEVGGDTDDKVRGLNPGSYVELIVKDTGEGIDPIIMKRIFDPFFTTKKIGEGTGLGLSVVHGIVRSYNGTIDVESRIGEGSSFHVYLPLLVEKPEASPREPERPDMAGKGRILLVDDEAMLANVTREMLEDRGYTVIARTDSIDALETFRADPGQFDLVITDQTMPDMTGIELAGNVMSIRPDIPVVLCTGFIDAAIEEKTTATGIRAIVLKPVSMKRLIALIGDLLVPEG